MQEFDLPRRTLVKASAGLVALASTGFSADEAWKPQLLDEHQLATVQVLEELIIPATDTPGAKEALVHRYVDLLLADGSDSERVRFLDGLSWLDSFARTKFQNPFLKLNATQQTQLLTILDRQTEVGVDDGTRFFRQLKSLVSRIYYNTAIGYRELNKGGRVPASYGCVDKAASKA
jgi:gluconate 2-dehydrogenase gamma chain